MSNVLMHNLVSLVVRQTLSFSLKNIVLFENIFLQELILVSDSIFYHSSNFERNKLTMNYTERSEPEFNFILFKQNIKK